MCYVYPYSLFRVRILSSNGFYNWTGVTVHLEVTHNYPTYPSVGVIAIL